MTAPASQAPMSALFGGDQIRLRDLQQWAGRTERAHGWAGEEPVDIPAKLCLIHSEVSEALEDYRRLPPGNDLCWDLRAEDGKPEGFASELADIVIRTLGLAEELGIDLTTICVAKQHYNDHRPYKHGGKRI